MIRLNCDYLEGCHPAILQRLMDTNMEQTVGYGMDGHCQHAAEMIRQAFGAENAAVHFLVGGTQANTTLIAAALRPYEGVICAATGHINVHETGAIESTGHKCLALPQLAGKITAAQVAEAVRLQANDEHTVKPGMVYISMSTEVGTLYTKAELEALYAACQALGLYLYIDGARLGYALAAPGCDISPADLPRLCDAFTVGGTKVGALFGEAMVIMRDGLNRDFRYFIKQRGGMLAKGRLLGIQFETLMEDGLYFSIARRAVAQALRIRDALAARGIPFFMDSPTNQQFPLFTKAQADALAAHFALETWETLPDGRVAMRICTSWATQDDFVDQLVEAIAAL